MGENIRERPAPGAHVSRPLPVEKLFADLCGSQLSLLARHHKPQPDTTTCCFLFSLIFFIALTTHGNLAVLISCGRWAQLETLRNGQAGLFFIGLTRHVWLVQGHFLGSGMLEVREDEADLRLCWNDQLHAEKISCLDVMLHSGCS